jgi:hypothetical protein
MQVMPCLAVAGALFVLPLCGNDHEAKRREISAEDGILVAVEKCTAEGGDRMNGAELSIEELAPPVLSPGWNDGPDSVEPASFGYQSSRRCEKVLLDEGREEKMAEVSPHPDQVFRKQVAWNELAAD